MRKRRHENDAHLVEVLVEVEYLSLVIVVTSLVVELPLGQELEL